VFWKNLYLLSENLQRNDEQQAVHGTPLALK